MFVAIEHKLDQLFQINVPEIVVSPKSYQQGFNAALYVILPGFFLLLTLFQTCIAYIYIYI